MATSSLLRLSFMYHPSQELDALARDWAKPPPDALFGLRVPIDYVHIQTAVRVAHQSFVQTHFLMSCSALSQEIMFMYATPFGFRSLSPLDGVLVDRRRFIPNSNYGRPRSSRRDCQ